MTITQQHPLLPESDKMGYHHTSMTVDDGNVGYQSAITVNNSSLRRMYRKKHDMESLTYVTVEHDAYFERQKHRKKRSEDLDNIRKWITSLLIGIFTGITAFAVHWTVDKIIYFKYLWMEQFLHFQAKESVHLGYLIFLSCNLLLVTISLVVIFLWKPAGGSGLPEVKGYLNGTRIPKAFNVLTFITKAISMICSVAAQLPAGPEGPFIHLGAMIGGGLGEWKSRTLRFSLPLMQNFRNSRDKRDFISSGAAAGVSAAFGSPIGGVLFALEEVSSYWSQSLTWRTFFSCLMATFTTNFIVRGVSGIYDLRAITIFNVGITKGYHVYEVPIFALVGIVGGIMGGIFCKCNVAIAKWRRDWLHKNKFRSAMEIWLVVLFVSTAFFYFPMLAECRPKQKGVEHAKAEIVAYLCPSKTTYNEMATLFLNRMEDVIRNLFARDVSDRFSIGTLILFFCTYYISACYTAGTYITAGLLIPMMIFGASFGRFVGVIVKLSLPTLAIDPGTYAVVGAAAATGGITRMTISLTVIMLEITNDLNYLFPLMVAVICAKWIGDLISHPLYDSLLELKKVHLLEPDPPFEMKALRCRDAMSHNPICLAANATVADIVHVLTSNNHNAFPVVKSEQNRSFVGLIMRSYLLLVLKFSVLGGQQMFTSLEIDNILNDKRIELDDLLDRLENHNEEVVNLSQFVHRSSVVVYHDSSLSTAYTMFRSLGLRQLTIINHRNEPVGMITRIDLSHSHIEKVYIETKYALDQAAEQQVNSSVQNNQ